MACLWQRNMYRLLDNGRPESQALKTVTRYFIFSFYTGNNIALALFVILLHQPIVNT